MSVVSPSFDDWYFRPVDGDRDGSNQNRAENNILGKDIDAKKCHANPDHRDNQGADQSSPYASDAAGNRRAPNNDSSDRRKEQFGRERRRTACKPPSEDNPGERR